MASSHRAPSSADVRRMRRRMLYACYALLAAECGVAALTSPTLAIREVRVSGIGALPVAEADAVVHAVGIAPGSNWFRIPCARIAAHLAAMPWVGSATVETRFPDRVYVRVAERSPVAVAEVGGRAIELDADAVPIRAARLEAATSLHHIVIAPVMSVVFGVPIQDDGVLSALRILHEVPEDVSARIAKIEVDQSDNLCLNMRDNTPIRLGQAEDLDAKLDQVRRICRSQPDLAKSFVAIDLTCPAKPACTPRVVSSLTPQVSAVRKTGLTQ